MGNIANSVKNNMTAMFANRNVNISKSARAKSTEKLASGYRVNRSADDAAGLSISEQTRRLARGLDKGCENINEGISLVKTAEGAMQEVEDILQRMNQLTVKGLTGTLTPIDRKYIQEEIDRLYEEIVRVADTTEFNEMPVLQGNPTKLHEQHLDEPIRKKVKETVSVSGLPDYVTMGPTTMAIGGANAAGLTQASSGDEAWKTVKQNGKDVNVSNSTWSPGLDDNYGTWIDFSGLASKSGQQPDTAEGEPGANEFYDAVKELIGKGFYTTCNSCTLLYNVVFKDSNGDYTFTSSAASGGTAYVDLKDILESAKNATTAADVQNVTKDLLNLIETTTATSSSMKDHYTRVRAKTDDSSNPYKLYIYDFRDVVYDTNKPSYGYIDNSSNPIIKGTIGTVSGTMTIDGKDELIYTTQYYSKDALNIQHAADAKDNSQINLPNLKGIFDKIYTKYGYASVKDSLTLQEYFPEHIYTAPGTYVDDQKWIEPREWRNPVYQQPDTPFSYVNGEKVTNSATLIGWDPPLDQPPHREEGYWKPYKKYVPGESSVVPERYGNLNYPMIAVIKDLINEVSALRVNLGAQQNKLEHSLRSNEEKKEEHIANETKQRDLDVPTEMVNFSCRNIVSQAGESMMAQSTHINNTVLKMLP